MTRTAGFTLIELSIVILIIALIIGGVLLGQSLILSASIRAAISQQEKIQSAVNVFHTKYNCLPGDCPNATDYNFTAPNTSISANGNGDDMVGPAGGYLFGAPYPVTQVPINEPVMFWQDLSKALLLPGYHYQGYNSGTPYPSSMQPYGMAFPSSIRQCGWIVGNARHADVSSNWARPPGTARMGNVLLLAGPNSLCSLSSCGGAQFSEGLTPYEAESIDAKIDDGFPFTGQVQAAMSANYIDSAPLSEVQNTASAANSCVNTSTTADPYADAVITSPYAPDSTSNRYRCNLLFKINGMP